MKKNIREIKYLSKNIEVFTSGKIVNIEKKIIKSEDILYLITISDGTKESIKCSLFLKEDNINLNIGNIIELNGKYNKQYKNINTRFEDIKIIYSEEDNNYKNIIKFYINDEKFLNLIIKNEKFFNEKEEKKLYLIMNIIKNKLIIYPNINKNIIFIIFIIYNYYLIIKKENNNIKYISYEHIIDLVHKNISIINIDDILPKIINIIENEENLKDLNCLENKLIILSILEHKYTTIQ